MVEINPGIGNSESDSWTKSLIRKISLDIELLNNVEKNILSQLHTKDFINLKFLFSTEVLDASLGLLNKLLELEKQRFEQLIKLPLESISFEDILNIESTDLHYFWTILNHIASVNNSDKIRQIITSFEWSYIEFQNSKSLNKDYFKIVEYCRAHSNLDSDQQRVLDLIIRELKLKWVDLSDWGKLLLNEIDIELASFSNKFKNNLLDSKKWFEIIITDYEKIKDIPEDILNNAKKSAENKGVDGYLFTADPNAYTSLLEYCSDWEIRKLAYDMWHKFSSYWEFDNRKIVIELIKLRKQKSEILWYKNYAELSLQKKMATSPDEVFSVIGWIRKKAKEKLHAEIEELKSHFWLEDIQSWDFPYYEKKYIKEKYNIDHVKLKEYFEFNNVLTYFFNFVKNFYGLEFKEINVENFDEKVRIYEVYKDWKLVSYCVLDLFYRKEKRAWAWVGTIRSKDILKWCIPIVTSNCYIQENLNWPTLLSYQNLKTLFHEFGHVLHEILSQSPYAQLSWLKVEWDFVELPSQLTENWITDPDCLKSVSRHIINWEQIDQDIVTNLKNTSTFGRWSLIIRQNEFALIDMMLHTLENIPESVEELDELILNYINQIWYYQRWDEYKMYASFQHIFVSSYAAGYYSYMRADIIVAQAWEYMKSQWIYDPNVWKHFIDTILWQWARKSASEMFQDFTWEWVSMDPFLKRNGL